MAKTANFTLMGPPISEIVLSATPQPSSYLAVVLGDNSSIGMIIVMVLGALILIVGILGTIGNSLVISVLKKRRKHTSFDTLLYCLAVTDLLNCLTILVVTTSTICFYEKLDHGLITLTFFHGSLVLFLFGKSVSYFMTVLITVERYLVIAIPMRSVAWFTATRTKIMTAGIIFLAALLNFPRWSSVWIEYNEGAGSVPSLAGKEYLLMPTPLEQFWYKSLRSIHYIDALAPFPLLLVFNVLLFMKISQYARNRQQLTKKQKVDIRAARMFIPVVITLFLCNVQPIAFYLVLRFKRICYRELASGMFLSVVVNSAANLPIYYARGSSFRGEVQSCLPNWINKMLPQQQDRGITTTTDTSRTETNISKGAGE